MTISPLVVGAVAVAVYFVVSRVMTPRASKEVIQEKISSGAVIVDVRTPGEFKGGAYPDAINMPLKELGTQLTTLSKDKPVVLYCHSGSRAALAMRMFKKAGFADVISAGGLHHMPH